MAGIQSAVLLVPHGNQEEDLFNGGKQYRCINPERLNFLPVYEYGKCFASKMQKLSNDDVTLYDMIW